jgi:hypothetical protein
VICVCALQEECILEGSNYEARTLGDHSFQHELAAEQFGARIQSGTSEAVLCASLASFGS